MISSALIPVLEAAPKLNSTSDPLPVGFKENPVGAPGGRKARTAFEDGEAADHLPDLLVERTEKVMVSVEGSMSVVQLVSCCSGHTSLPLASVTT